MWDLINQLLSVSMFAVFLGTFYLFVKLMEEGTKRPFEGDDE